MDRYRVCIEAKDEKVVKNNGLSIMLLALFLFSIIGQIFTGWHVHNEERELEGAVPLPLFSYLSSGHFIQATFENWESEFLQMALFVLLTVSLRQKGSAESKSCDEKEEVDRTPDPNRKDAPWPVRKGGWILRIYQNSLSIALLLLFVLSFILHLYGSLKDENEQLQLKGLPTESFRHYIFQSRFWFESFQNWQSEFLSVLAIVLFSVFLRQKGSSQSKPADAPDADNE